MVNSPPNDPEIMRGITMDLEKLLSADNWDLFSQLDDMVQKKTVLLSELAQLDKEISIVAAAAITACRK